MGEVMLRVLLLGDCNSKEGRAVSSEINASCPDADIRSCDGLARLLDDWSPQLVVVCRNRPHEHSTDEVTAVLAAFPLARWVVVCGAWCESDGRHGTPWPLALCVPARQFRARWERELEALRREDPPPPFTASRAETFAHRLPQSRQFTAPTSVAVRSSDRELRSWLEDVIRKAGGEVVNQDRAEIIVWDLDPWSSRLTDALQEFRNSRPAVPIIGVAGAALLTDVEAMRAAGVNEVVPKLSIEDSLVSICRSLTSNSAGARCTLPSS